MAGATVRNLGRMQMLRSAALFLSLALAGCPDSSPGEPATSTAGSAHTGVVLPRPAPSARVKIELQRPAMGTAIHLVAYTNERASEAGVRQALERAFEEIERLARVLSEWRAESEVSAINRRPGEPVKVGIETFTVISKGMWSGSISDGAFDITFQTMGDLWKFGDAAEKTPRVPSASRVAQKRKLVDYTKVVLDPDERSVTIPKGTQIGLGGIAKGYIVDRAVDVLRRAGVSDFLVQAGGDLYGAGRKPDGLPWLSGVQDPRGAKDDYFAVIELTDRAFSTAGDYARSYVVAGKRYHHIIDPRTGYPATASRSVTIWAPDAFLADAVDDCVFILGPEKGLLLVESLEGVGAVIVDARNKVWVSRRVQGKVRILKQPSDAI